MGGNRPAVCTPWGRRPAVWVAEKSSYLPRYVVCLSLLALTPCFAAGGERRALPPLPSAERQEEALPPDEPPFMEEDYRRLPPGVELRPDGSLLQGGLVIGRLASDSPRRRRMRRMREFSTQWVPVLLYANDWRLFAPYRIQDVAAYSAKQRLTGLTTAPMADILLYAVAEKSESMVLGRRLDEYSAEPPRPIVTASDLASDLWFHQPMFLSPDKRWLLVAASGGRRGAVSSWNAAARATPTRPDSIPSDLWLVDCARQLAPRRVLSSAVLESVSWSPDGQQAICKVQRQSEGEVALTPSLLLLDAEQATLVGLGDAGGDAFWSDAETLRVYPGSAVGEIAVYSLKSGPPRQVASGGGWIPPAAVAWSPDGTRCAYSAKRDQTQVICIADPSGRAREALAGREALLLGWSGRSELFAYLALDNTLRFSSGAISTAGFERLVSAISPVVDEHDETQPGPVKSAAENIGMDTAVSPLVIDVSGPVFSAWTETKEGPCLVYAENSPDGSQKLRALRFLTLTLADMGLNPREDLQAQMLRQRSENSAQQLSVAIREYLPEERPAADPGWRNPVGAGAEAVPVGTTGTAQFAGSRSGRRSPAPPWCERRAPCPDGRAGAEGQGRRTERRRHCLRHLYRAAGEPLVAGARRFDGSLANQFRPRGRKGLAWSIRAADR